MLTERTTSAFLVIESIDPERSGHLRDALDMLAAWTQKCLGGTTRIEILNRNHVEVVLHGR